ncbi:MAG: hypothetical protein PGN26_02320 [Xylophilus ampelinus]
MQPTLQRAVRFAVIIACGVLIGGCGGEGGGDAGASSTDKGDASASANVKPASFAGTYSTLGNKDTLAAFSLDDSARVTACTLGSAAGCVGQANIDATGKMAFSLSASNGNAYPVKGSIASGGSFDAIASDGEKFDGKRLATTFATCPENYTLQDSKCVEPADSRVEIAPMVVWEMSLVNGGRNYVLMLCYGGLNRCVSISSTLFVSNADLSDTDFPEILAYAESVANEYRAMLLRLWAEKSYPSLETISSIFRKSIDDAVKNDTPNAVETAAANFSNAGYPAAAGKQGGTSSSTPPKTPEQFKDLKMLQQPVGYLQINTPPAHRTSSTDICTSWQVIGAPVSFSTCSYAGGGSGYFAFQNGSASPADICLTLRFNNPEKSPSKTCNSSMPSAKIIKESCFSCGQKNGGVRSVTLNKFDKTYYD